MVYLVDIKDFGKYLKIIEEYTDFELESGSEVESLVLYEGEYRFEFPVMELGGWTMTYLTKVIPKDKQIQTTAAFKKPKTPPIILGHWRFFVDQFAITKFYWQNVNSYALIFYGFFRKQHRWGVRVSWFTRHRGLLMDMSNMAMYYMFDSEAKVKEWLDLRQYDQKDRSLPPLSIDLPAVQCNLIYK